MEHCAVPNQPWEQLHFEVAPHKSTEHRENKETTPMCFAAVEMHRKMQIRFAQLNRGVGWRWMLELLFHSRG